MANSVVLDEFAAVCGGETHFNFASKPFVLADEACDGFEREIRYFVPARPRVNSRNRLETLRAGAALDPKPIQVICLDHAFEGNDQLKTNVVLEMESHGINFRTV